MNKLYKIHIKNNKSHWDDGTDINYFFNNENSALKFMNKQYNEIFEERGISKEKIDNKNYIIYEDLDKFLLPIQFNIFSKKFNAKLFLKNHKVSE